MGPGTYTTRAQAVTSPFGIEANFESTAVPPFGLAFSLQPELDAF